MLLTFQVDRIFFLTYLGHISVPSITQTGGVGDNYRGFYPSIPVGFWVTKDHRQANKSKEIGRGVSGHRERQGMGETGAATILDAMAEHGRRKKECIYWSLDAHRN